MESSARHELVVNLFFFLAAQRGSEKEIGGAKYRFRRVSFFLGGGGEDSKSIKAIFSMVN